MLSMWASRWSSSFRGPRVAGVATTVGEPVDAFRGVPDADYQPGVVDVADLAVGNDKLQRANGDRDGAVGAGDHRQSVRRPGHRGVRFDDREAGVDEGDEPGVRSGAEDPPLRRVGETRVCLVRHRRPVGMRIGPWCQAAAGLQEGGLDPSLKLLELDHSRMMPPRRSVHGEGSDASLPLSVTGRQPSRIVERGYRTPSTARVRGASSLAATLPNTGVCRLRGRTAGVTCDGRTSPSSAIRWALVAGSATRVGDLGKPQPALGPFAQGRDPS